MYSKTLRFFSQYQILEELLKRKGMSDKAGSRHARHFVGLARDLIQSGAHPDARAQGYWVPGRIEVMGKHTDYGGGMSLLAALEKGFCLLAVPEDNSACPPSITLMDTRSGETLHLPPHDEALPLPSSAIYPLTVLERGRQNFGGLKVGGKLAFRSDLPRASGMSSSSAFMIAIFMALRDLNGWDKTAAYTAAIKKSVDLADYLGHVENGQTYKTLIGERGVGTFGGSQDHAAILCSKPNQVTMMSFRPTRLQASIAMPDDLVFCLASSGVKASKTRGAREQYNDAARRAQHVVSAWNEWKQQKAIALAEVVRHPEFELTSFCKHLRGVPDGVSLANRLTQFHAEVTQLIPDVVTALKKNDQILLAQAVKQSQDMAEKMLGNQIEETAYLAQAAASSGAIAASAFGAGFGGAVWALVKAERHRQFIDDWRKGYERAFPQHASRADFFADATGPAAFAMP